MVHPDDKGRVGRPANESKLDRAQLVAAIQHYEDMIGGLSRTIQKNLVLRDDIIRTLQTGRAVSIETSYKTPSQLKQALTFIDGDLHAFRRTVALWQERVDKMKRELKRMPKKQI